METVLIHKQPIHSTRELVGTIAGQFVPARQSEKAGLWGDCPIVLVDGKRHHAPRVKVHQAKALGAGADLSRFLEIPASGLSNGFVHVIVGKDGDYVLTTEEN